MDLHQHGGWLHMPWTDFTHGLSAHTSNLEKKINTLIFVVMIQSDLCCHGMIKTVTGSDNHFKM